jgi:hypothetical protein
MSNVIVSNSSDSAVLSENKHFKQGAIEATKAFLTSVNIKKSEKKALKDAEKSEKKALKDAEKASKKIINRGTGAGGENTTKKGKPFEVKTDCDNRLMLQGYIGVKLPVGKQGYIQKMYDDGTMIYSASQESFIPFMKVVFPEYLVVNERKEYKIKPDEARIIVYSNGSKPDLIITEKKFQGVEGTVEEKLFGGPYKKFMYNKMFCEKFNVHYTFVVSSFLENRIKKHGLFGYYDEFNSIHNIPTFYGSHIDYEEKHEKWISDIRESHI